MDIRPIRSMAGAVYHYEVFIDNVSVHADYRLGGENEGFTRLRVGAL